MKTNAKYGALHQVVWWVSMPYNIPVITKWISIVSRKLVKVLYVFY